MTTAPTDFQLFVRTFSRPKIYVAGPMARTPYEGPRRAALLARELWHAGFTPIVPQLNALFEMAAGPLDEASPDGICGWLEYDFALMAGCSYITRCMPDVPSSGADRELALAAKVGVTFLTPEEALLGPPETR